MMSKLAPQQWASVWFWTAVGAVIGSTVGGYLGSRAAREGLWWWLQ